MAIKILFYSVLSYLEVSTGVPLAAGDEVSIILNTTRNPALPAQVPGIVQAVTMVTIMNGGCPAPGTQYTISYDSDDLEGAVTELAACDVSALAGVSCCQALRTALDAEILARQTGDAALQADLDSWDVIELTAEPSDGVSGVQQIETQTVVGTAGASGNLPVVFTAVGLTGSPLTLNVPVVFGDTDAVIAGKIVAFAEATAATNAFFEFDQIGPVFATKWRTAAANDGTGNVAINAFTGITPDGSSVDTQTGVAPVAGTVPQRIGQHARWGNRIWEATDLTPPTWVEISTELSSVQTDSNITSMVGGASTNLDALDVDSSMAGRVQLVNYNPFSYVMKLEAGTNAENSPFVVRPDNYAPTTNEFVWKLQPTATLSAAILDASEGGNGAADSGLVLKFGASGQAVATAHVRVRDISNPTTVYSFLTSNGVSFTGGGFTLAINTLFTGNRNLYYPDCDGLLLAERQVIATSPLTGATINASRYRDQFHYVTPAGTIAALTFNLPAVADCRLGQRIELFTSQIVTALTIGANGGTLVGTTPTAATANGLIEYSCVAIAGTATWARTR